MKRRTLLQASLLPVGTSGLFYPALGQAAYPVKAFQAEKIPDALREAFGSADIGESDQIEIDAPGIANDAGMVPVRIRSGLADTESITLVVSANPSPFTAVFRLYEPRALVSTRIRLADSSDLLVIVKADGKLYTSTRRVRVGRNQCRA